MRLFSVPTPQVSWLDDPATFNVWEACQEWGAKVSVCLLPEELPRLGKMLARFPDTAVVLDHCGFADFSDGPPWNAARPLWELAKYQNLYLKVTTNVLDAAGALPATLVHHFGANRLMWGSDYPQIHDRTYSDLVTLANTAAKVLTPEEQTHFLADTAHDFWASY